MVVGVVPESVRTESPHAVTSKVAQNTAPSPTPPGDDDVRRRIPRVGLLGLPPWRRAPVLAAESWPVVWAVIAAMAILACASSSIVLFLSSAGSASLQRQITAQCPDAALPAITSAIGGQVIASQRYAAPDPTLDSRVRTAMERQGLPMPHLTMVGGAQLQLAASSTDVAVRLFYGSGALDQVDVLQRLDQPGVWLPTDAANSLGVGLGDFVVYGGLPVIVAGVYADLYRAPIPEYWCQYRSLLIPLSGGLGSDANRPPPSLVLATDAQVFRDLEAAAGDPSTLVWTSPIRTDGLTRSAAEKALAGQATALQEVGPEDDPLRKTTATGALDSMVHDTVRVEQGLQGTIIPIGVGGSVLAALLVGAAGGYWVERRQREARLLASRGIGPVALGIKAVLEMTLPAAIGTVLGWWLATRLVRAVGPSPYLDTSAPLVAGAIAGAALLTGLLLLGAVAGLRSKNIVETPTGRSKGWFARIPWEFILLGAAAYCLVRLITEPVVTLDGNTPQISGLVAALPLLLLLGGSALFARVVTWLLPAVRSRSRRWPLPAFLAMQRISGAPRITVSILVAVSLPIGLVIYSGAVTSSSAYTIELKSRVLIGSSASVRVTGDVPAPAAVADQVTTVHRYEYVAADQDEEVTLLAVDAETLGDYIPWDDRFANDPLPRILDLLRTAREDGTVPALAVGGSLGETRELDLVGRTTELTVVSTPAVFPGRRLDQPLFIVDDTTLGAVPDLPRREFTEFWTDQDPAPVVAALADSGVTVRLVLDEETALDAARLLPVTWAFGYLQALAALVGLIAVSALTLYLETRQRARSISYAMSQRMGMTRRTHLRSLLVEFSVVLLTAGLLGAALAWAATLAVVANLDLDATRPPPTLMSVPYLAFAGAATGLIVTVGAAALYAQHAAHRNRTARLL